MSVIGSRTQNVASSGLFPLSLRATNFLEEKYHLTFLMSILSKNAQCPEIHDLKSEITEPCILGAFFAFVV